MPHASCESTMMDFEEIFAEAGNKHRNAMPLPNKLGAPVFCGSDVTKLLHKYEGLSDFTGTDVSENCNVTMFLYYCVEGPYVREKVMIMHGYADHNWAALKKQMQDVFW
ncbi:hypothetical protein K440DRAFT_642020 [Wilcoxina mikolae CBS 423.85]|nr:hypothetical protein K440DRAFT_642020 [Wilcoxina mikolae CBS 423.85]